MTRLLKWYLFQMIPVSSNVKATDLVVKVTQHFTPNNLKLFPTTEKLVKYVSDKRAAINPIPKSAATVQTLILTDDLTKTNKGTKFLWYRDLPPFSRG